MSAYLPINERHRLVTLYKLALLFAPGIWLGVIQIRALVHRPPAPPEGWSWSALILIDIVITIVIGRIIGNYYRDSHTTLTDKGITQKTLLGTKTTRWKDVNEFTLVGYMLHLPGPHGGLTVNTGAYTDSTNAIIDRITGYIDNDLGEDEADAGDEEHSSLPAEPTVI
jgi:hypothetical protein